MGVYVACGEQCGDGVFKGAVGASKGGGGEDGAGVVDMVSMRCW